MKNIPAKGGNLKFVFHLRHTIHQQVQPSYKGETLTVGDVERLKHDSTELPEHTNCTGSYDMKNKQRMRTIENVPLW